MGGLPGNRMDNPGNPPPAMETRPDATATAEPDEEPPLYRLGLLNIHTSTIKVINAS